MLLLAADTLRIRNPGAMSTELVIGSPMLVDGIIHPVMGSVVYEAERSSEVGSFTQSAEEQLSDLQQEKNPAVSTLRQDRHVLQMPHQ